MFNVPIPFFKFDKESTIRYLDQDKIGKFLIDLIMSRMSSCIVIVNHLKFHMFNRMVGGKYGEIKWNQSNEL